MADDPLDELATWAEAEIPEPPDHFDRTLHGRVNRSLLVLQLLELPLRVLPWTLMHFAPAVAALLRETFSGGAPREKTELGESGQGDSSEGDSEQGESEQGDSSDLE